MNEPKYDNWKLDTPDNHLKVHTYCLHCLNAIHKGETYYSTLLGSFCDSNCFTDYAKEYHDGEYKEADKK